MILTIQFCLEGELHVSEVDPELPAPDGEKGDVLRVESLGEPQDQGIVPAHCRKVVIGVLHNSRLTRFSVYPLLLHKNLKVRPQVRNVVVVLINLPVAREGEK